MNEHDGLAVPRPVIGPTTAETLAVAESNAAIAQHYEADVVDRRATALKENPRLTVDDDVKTFRPEVLARLVRKSKPEEPR
jgi:hypothetical protein